MNDRGCLRLKHEYIPALLLGILILRVNSERITLQAAANDSEYCFENEIIDLGHQHDFMQLFGKTNEMT